MGQVVNKSLLAHHFVVAACLGNEEPHPRPLQGCEATRQP